MRTRILRLDKDTLRELTNQELRGVAAGDGKIPTWYSGCVTTVYPTLPLECEGNP